MELAPPPSPIFRKEKPQASLGLGLFPGGYSDVPGLYQEQQDSSHRLDSINDYLYSNCSARPVKLTGMDHFINQLWNLGKFAIAGAAFIGYVETQRK